MSRDNAENIWRTPTRAKARRWPVTPPASGHALRTAPKGPTLGGVAHPPEKWLLHTLRTSLGQKQSPGPTARAQLQAPASRTAPQFGRGMERRQGRRAGGRDGSEEPAPSPGTRLLCTLPSQRPHQLFGVATPRSSREKGHQRGWDRAKFPEHIPNPLNTPFLEAAIAPHIQLLGLQAPRWPPRGGTPGPSIRQAPLPQPLTPAHPPGPQALPVPGKGEESLHWQVKHGN